MGQGKGFITDTERFQARGSRLVRLRWVHRSEPIMVDIHPTARISALTPLSALSYTCRYQFWFCRRRIDNTGRVISEFLSKIIWTV
jgi:hypothetical protein